MSNQERAARVKHIRSCLDLSLKAFSEHYGIPLDTLKAWEAPSREALSEKAALRLSTLMQRARLNVSVQWLLYGQGPEPRFYPDISLEEKERQQEIALFLDLHPNGIIFHCQDSSLFPHFLTGDILGGLWQDSHLTQALDRQFCLFERPKLGLCCRRLVARGTLGTFDSYATYFEVDVPNLIEKNIPLTRAAPVIRWWRHK